MRTVDAAPSVLVGMLHVGEPSVLRVRERIHAQRDVRVELQEFAHLAEREAHAHLYAAFDAADEQHDALVKVDADMELVEPRLLHAIAMLFVRHPDLDHIMIGVDDWFSGRRIQGMTAWRRGVRWTSPPPELFTDLPTNTSVTKLKLMDVGRPLVLHANDPTDEQAIRYGLHRGLKALATGKASRIARLADVVDHAAEAPERGRRLAVAAILLAFEDRAAAEQLLGTTTDGEPTHALTRVTSLADDPTIVTRVREHLDATVAPDTVRPIDDASPRVLGGRRGPLASLRERLTRGARAGLPDEGALHAEFLALLDGPRDGS